VSDHNHIKEFSYLGAMAMSLLVSSTLESSKSGIIGISEVST